ncbi:MAG: hypothetical protein BGO26_15380 [Actinobacteria bacterium 69-20]|jgi:vancomycin permeability regulator SanA|nr:YdcF family protein [Actinomycetota bacterium]OJV28703.1 MAG: hypothetical protein BGO26_15380 [Actinobacteria bacterium 69-20]
MGNERGSDEHTARSRRARKRLPIVMGTAVVTIAAITIGCTLWVRASTAAHRFTLADAPTTPVAIVLGAGLLADGAPSPALRARLDDAITLFGRDTVQALLVSGDNGTIDHDEPTAMRDYLVAHGIPDSKIVLDYAGFSTWDSCVRAKEVFGVRRVLVVTQQFHLPRAVFLCRHAGLDANGASDDHPEAGRASFALREIPANVKAAWSAIVHPSPKYLGPHETGIDDALAE